MEPPLHTDEHVRHSSNIGGKWDSPADHENQSVAKHYIAGAWRSRKPKAESRKPKRKVVPPIRRDCLQRFNGEILWRSAEASCHRAEDTHQKRQ